MKLYDGKKVAEVNITWIEGGEELDVEEERIDEVLLHVANEDKMKYDPETGKAVPVYALGLNWERPEWGWDTVYRVDDDIEEHIAYAMDWLRGGVTRGDIPAYDPDDPDWTVTIERI